MPVTFSLVGVSLCTNVAVGIAGQVRGGDARHLVERRDEAVDMAAHLGAFAEREDVGIGGVHAAIDEDAAIRRRARLAWPMPALGRMPAAMITSVAGMMRPSASSTPSTLRSPRIALVDGLGDDLDAALLELPLQHVAGGRVELALHQRRHQMQRR